MDTGIMALDDDLVTPFILEVMAATPVDTLKDALSEMGYVLDEKYDPVLMGSGQDASLVYCVFVPNDEQNLGEKRPEDYDFIRGLWPDVRFEPFGPP